MNDAKNCLGTFACCASYASNSTKYLCRSTFDAARHPQRSSHNYEKLDFEESDNR